MAEFQNSTRNWRFIDLTGQVFGRLRVVEEAGVRSGKTLWLCHCECGTTRTMPASSLRNGHTKSCGCQRRAEPTKRHGHAKKGKPSPTYIVWCAMRQRAMNRKADRWKDYGGRGIGCCERWNKFENFLADMGERPIGLTIDRIDNNLGYFKKNCRWATQGQQNANQRPKSRSGLKGAHQHSPGRWQSEIVREGKRRFLGTFATPEEAHAAYLRAALEDKP